MLLRIRIPVLLLILRLCHYGHSRQSLILMELREHIRIVQCALVGSIRYLGRRKYCIFGRSCEVYYAYEHTLLPFFRHVIQGRNTASLISTLRVQFSEAFNRLPVALWCDSDLSGGGLHLLVPRHYLSAP